MIDKYERGFTLLETVIALGIFMVLTLAAIQGITYAAEVSGRLTVKAELLENARIAMDFMSAHIKEADKIEITAQSGTKSLKTMKVTRYVSTNKVESHVFQYDAKAVSGSTKYQRLEFGGNELAGYIAGMEVDLQNNVLSLKIITDTKLNYTGGSVTDPIILHTKIKVYNAALIVE